jgi:hypothetical protein
MNEELKKLYGVLTRDGYYTKSYDEFTNQWNDSNYRKKVYDVVRRDNLFTKDYNSFEAKYSAPQVKKKDSSDSPSQSDPKKSTSVTPQQEKQKPSGSSAIEDGIYKYPFKKDAIYKREGGKWFIDPTGGNNFVEVKDPTGERYSNLNKDAVKVTKEPKTIDQKIKDEEDLRDLSNKEAAEILGWSEEEFNKASTSNKKSTIKPIAANINPDVIKGDNAINVQANSLAKARVELGSEATTENINNRAKYYENINVQRSLKNKGYDVDINGDLDSEKTQIALDKLSAEENLKTKEEINRESFVSEVDNLINDDLFNSGTSVADLRNNFSKDGFIFNEFGGNVAGTGKLIKVKYSPSSGVVTREETFRLDDPEIKNKLKMFMSQSYMKPSEKKLLTGGNADVSLDEMGRFEYMSELVNKMAENPQKYGKTLISEDLFVNHMKSTYNYLRDEQISISQRYDQLKQKISVFNQNPTEEGREAINNEIHELKVRELKLTDKYDKAKVSEKNFAKISAAYAVEKSKTGGLFSGLAAQFGQGIANIGKMEASLAADILPYIVDAVDPITKERLKIDGYSDEQIRDYASKEIKNGVLRDLKKGITNVASLGQATQEYLEIGDRGVLEETLGFLAESIGTAMSGGGSGALTKLAFFSQAYNGMSEQMTGPEFDGISEHQKKLIAVPYALAIGQLERLGFKFTTSTSKNPVLNKLISNTIAKTFTSIPKDASIKTIERAISNNLAATMVQAGLRISGGSLVEGTVEGTQQLTEIGIKNIANAIIGEDEQGFDFFKDVPDLTTVDGVKDALKLASVDFAYGALGGAIMSTGENAVSAVRNKGIQMKAQKEFLSMAATLTDSKLRALQDLDIQRRVSEGEITQEQANEITESMNKATEVIGKIPDKLSTKDKIESFNLLLERSDLEKEIQGKDESLSVVQKERIKEINVELQNISRDAVQEQTAGQVPVQPEVAVGGEVEERAPEAEPQVVTEKSNKEKIDELEGMIASDNQSMQETGTGNLLPEARTEILNELEQLKSKNTTVEEEITPESYVDELNKTIESDPETYWSVSKVDLDTAKNSKIVGDSDGKGIVTPDGDIKGVFKALSSSIKGVADKVLAAAVKAGGIKLDNYDNYLTKTYTRNGFRVVSRTPFNEEFAPDGWNKEKHGTPDVVAMVYDPDNKLDIEEKSFEDYDQAMEYRDRLVDQAREIYQTQDTDTDVDAEVEALGALIDMSTDEAIEESVKANVPTKIQKAVKNAAKALSKIAPNVKIVVHKSDEEYRKATGEEGNKMSSNGEYNPKTKTIHINLTKANMRTVAHEAFHAILLERVSSDTEAANVTKRMLDAISKKLEADSDLKKYLDDFASNYKENIQNEEKLAELVGKLAEKYTSSPETVKDIITRWLNVLASKFGLGPISKDETYNVLETIARKVATGKTIKEKDVSGISAKSDKISDMNKRFQADFSDVVSKLSFVYDTNSDRFKSLEKEGYITKDKSLADFDEKYMFIHQPDAAFSGSIYKGGEILVEGKGGVFYPIKFHEDGYFWASTDTTAEKMASDLNKVMEQNNGTIYMALTSAPYDKLLSSTTASNGVLDLILSKAFDDNFKLSETQVKDALINSANHEVLMKTLIKDSDGNPVLDSKGNKQYKEKKVGLKLGVSNSMSIDEIVKSIRESLAADVKSFADRKTFVNELIKSISNNINENNISIEQFGRLFSEGIQNKYFKGITKTGKVKVSTANMTQAISEMLTEPMLKEGVNRDKGGQVYAIIELNGPVKPVKSDKHESYPMAIQSDSDSKVKLHILKDRQNWSDVFEDFETNKIVDSKKRQMKIFPTSGVSVRGLKVNTSKVSPRKQLDEFISRKQQKSASSIVSIARKNGFSEDAIRKYLAKNGFSESEIKSAMIVNDNITIDEIFERSEKALTDKKRSLSIVRAVRFLRQKMLDRQSDIKRVVKGIGSKESAKAHAMIVTKAGAKGWANYRFKEAEKKIYKGLSNGDIDNLNKIIYMRRMIAINENRAKIGMEAYKGIDGYSEAEAKRDLAALESQIGEKKFSKLSDRADNYFAEFAETLKSLRDSGRITDETYESLKDVEYSPIATIKYIIGDNLSVDEIDRQAEVYGITRKDIMKLSDKNENEIIMDSRWLLMMNLMSVTGRAWENRMLNSFFDAYNSATVEQKEAMSEFILGGGPSGRTGSMKAPAGYKAISFYRDGVAHNIIVRADFANQLLDVKHRDKAFETLGKLTGGSILRFFATGGNPLFIVGNTAVDFQNILFFSDTYSSFKPLGAVQLTFGVVKNFMSKVINNGTYNKINKEYLEHGGGMDFLSNDGLKALKAMKPANVVLSVPQKILVNYGNVMSYLGATSEAAFRLSVYEKMKSNLIEKYKKENGSEPTGQDLDDIMWEAARESRETIDFSQGGDWVKKADVVMPYLNAAMQGFRKPIDFAKKNPAGFAVNMVQASVLAGGVAYMSYAALAAAVREDGDDEDDVKKKMKEAMKSVSEHEKASYHIIFTGNKMKDKNGEWIYEYYRVKKLPLLSVLSTLSEQIVAGEVFGADYDNDLTRKTLSMSAPFLPSEISGRNPLISGLLTYHFNKDTFTDEKVFRDNPDKPIRPEAEGRYDDKVEDVYKEITKYTKYLGLESPIRTKAFFEKIVTNPTTNPTIAVFYAAANGIIGDKPFIESMKEVGGDVGESAQKKVKRYTNNNVKSIQSEGEADEFRLDLNTYLYEKESKIRMELKRKMEKGEDITPKWIFDKVDSEFNRPEDVLYKKSQKLKHLNYVKRSNIDPEVISILFESNPEMQAYLINKRYGGDLQESEINEIREAISKTDLKISDKTVAVYNLKYKKKGAE